MKIIICGSRTIKDKDRVFAILDEFHRAIPITHVIVGGAAGADSIGEQWARERHITFGVFRPKWQRADGSTDRAAGYKRNSLMLSKEPEMVIAFVDRPIKESKGTYDMINKANSAGVEHHVFRLRESF
jgi:hypothetical protein